MARIHQRISPLALDQRAETGRAIVAAGRTPPMTLGSEGDKLVTQIINQVKQAPADQGGVFVYAPIDATGALHRIRILATDEGVAK